MLLKDFSGFLEKISSGSLHVLGKSIPKSKYIPLNLSKSNKALQTVHVASVSELGNYVNTHIKNNNGLVAYGGYLEARLIYKRSAHFNAENEKRNIHLGVDFWSSVETPVYAPLNTTVHSFKNNTHFGDYGPTIILEHKIDAAVFYTLYGHLSLQSIKNLKKGKVFKQGEQIATLGDPTINGNYPPHLHFQIIRNLQDKFGDYPVVCSKSNLEFYSKNCPNPNLLLKLEC
jgi:murein DD-endopeptidase MepM/ murein hydrolase activator NlpD